MFLYIFMPMDLILRLFPITKYVSVAMLVYIGSSDGSWEPVGCAGSQSQEILKRGRCFLNCIIKIFFTLQDGFPIRIKAVNIINEPRIFKGIFAIIKPFLKEKIANRVRICVLLTFMLMFVSSLLGHCK